MAVTFSVDENYTLRFTEDAKELLTLAESLNEEKGVVTIAAKGLMVNAAAYPLRDELKALASVNMKVQLVMDGLNYIGNLCADSLLEVQQQIDKYGKGSLTLLQVPKEVMESLKSTAVDDCLIIE